MFVCILRAARHNYGLIYGTADYYMILISQYCNLYQFLYILEVQHFKYVNNGSVNTYTNVLG